MQFLIEEAGKQHIHFAKELSEMLEVSANKRGTGIAKRSAEYLSDKIKEGKAVIAFSGQGQLAGFCYIETWSHGKYVANSGLIVHEEFRKFGLAKKIKAQIFKLSREKYPDAKIFGITTSLAVMKINSELGYKPVTFSELTHEEEFWAGCKSCKNYDVLQRTGKTHCLCTGMLYSPEKDQAIKEQQIEGFSATQIPVPIFHKIRRYFHIRRFRR
ncbi:GNAT family N-acetyltransferase [Xanthovirga aplysinae]|uniref:GNAT family N-acetyltransferase n=1 Tax=Xanthovirga aplysinae TaxID=2529853 RepID=UPI0012BC4576|nr:GNAT family N-acetyltransferase [Xanthovirga aplysinae]MTI32732.1 GNAT family N-acetyltransferase [Xanthovirga aplysinae]